MRLLCTGVGDSAEAGNSISIPGATYAVLLLGAASATAALVRRRTANASGAQQADGGSSCKAAEPMSEARTAQYARVRALLALFLLALVCAGTTSWSTRWIPLLQGLGMLSAQSVRACTPPSPAARLAVAKEMWLPSVPVTSDSLDAITLIQQGFMFAFDFNQPEALASFRAALSADTSGAPCAALLGVAYALGPFVNKVPGDQAQAALYPVFSAEDFAAAGTAARDALACAERVERHAPQHAAAVQQLAWAQAMVARYSAGSHLGVARIEAERRYAARLQEAGERWQDATALAMAAEALMNTSPWDYYRDADAQGGSAHLRPDAAAALELLLAAARIEGGATHPLVAHLTVHLLEPATADRAARAEAAADYLAGRYARAGHLLHMPSHLYLRAGRFHDAVLVNLNATAADSANAASCMQPYLPEHNLNMLVYAASMAGEYAAAARWAAAQRDMEATVGWAVGGDHEWVTLPLLAVRHADWAAAAAARGPGGDPGAVAPVRAPQYAEVVARFVRLMAAAARGGGSELQGELDALHAAVEAVPFDPVTRPGRGLGIYSLAARNVSSILLLTARARLAAADGDAAAAVEHLAAAVALEDSMGYIEPPRTLQPARQCLGWALLAAGRPLEAGRVYERDLLQFPRNGWSLLGAAQAAEAAGDADGAAHLRRQFDEAWRYADVPLDSSCPAFSVFVA